MAFYIQAVSLEPRFIQYCVFTLGGGGDEKEVPPWSLLCVWDSKVQGLDGVARQIRWKVPKILFFLPISTNKILSCEVTNLRYLINASCFLVGFPPQAPDI